MVQIVLNIENTSILGPLVKIINALDGVSISKTVKSKTTGLEEAYDDIRVGRVYQAKDTDDMFHQVLGV